MDRGRSRPPASAPECMIVATAAIAGEVYIPAQSGW